MVLMFRLLNIVCLLALPLSTHQVDIVLEWWRESIAYWDNLVTYRCIDISPGTCCQPHPELFTSSINTRRASGTAFLGLRQGQFGAGWPARRNRSGDYAVDCTGQPILRVYGPSDTSDDRIEEYRPPWGEEIDSTPEDMVFGAAWIDLRLRFPASSAATRYLMFQGVRGLVWGKETWNAGSDGIPFPKVRRGEKVLSDQALHGKATISTPSRWVYPNSYTINKTDYVNGGTGAYIDREGRVLDLKTL